MYFGEHEQTFWVVSEDGEKVGMLRIFDLQDPCPMMDVRIKSAYRGKGIGVQAIKWVTEYIFNNWKEIRRIEGQTRHDNIAMRKVFLKCGYVKEAHYRKDWPGQNEEYYDGIGYGITREDWEQGIVTPPDWDDEDF